MQYVTTDWPNMLLVRKGEERDGRVAVENENGTVHEVEVKRLIPLVQGGAPDLTVDTPQAFVSLGRILIATYHGPCVVCARRTYSLNTGDSSGMGENAESGLDAKDFDLIGPHVPLCLICANTAEAYERGVELAKATLWKPRPPQIEFDLSAFKIGSEAFWEKARLSGDGYDVMDEAATHEWVAVSSWGRDGWDLLEWPYYVLYVRNTAAGFELATNCEGDVDAWRFPTLAERQDAIDKLAFANWQRKEEEWVEGIHPDEIPAYLRGPYLVDRSE
jgi:hypothetical protein